MNTPTRPTSAVTRSTTSRAANGRAFTLVEMLTVIGILAIVLAIIIPAMGMARRSARNADTRNTLGQLGNAVSAFSNDQRHLPGYFSARQMGDPSNTARGFTSMENIMIDLVGGITTQAVNNPTIIMVGPGPTPRDTVLLDVNAMGSSTQTKNGVVNKGYLPMDAKRFVPQGGDPVAGTVGDIFKRVTSQNDHYFFPTLVDPFGQPILAWVADDIPSTGVFAAMDNTIPNGAKFYWNQNAGFLGASKLGKQGESQVYSAGPPPLGSVIGTNNPTPSNVTRSLESLLGNPAAPDPAAPAATPRPLAARAPILFHSAGADGVYMNVRDRGARPGYIYYTPNQDPFGGALFDDLISGAGN